MLGAANNIKTKTASGGKVYFKYFLFLLRSIAIVNGTGLIPVSYTHLRAHETVLDLVCRLLLEKKKKTKIQKKKRNPTHTHRH